MKKNNFLVLDTPEAGLCGNGEVCYPRPQLRRDSFFSLDGEWAFSAKPKGFEPEFNRRIRLPFVPESALSGIGERFPDGTELCYHRKFKLPEGFTRDRVILHIGAADQVAKVWLNGHFLGEHVGGYFPFSFDVTKQLLPGQNTLFICVTDHLDKHILPWGKQKHKRGGMWYTPVSGIWQSVWMESVPQSYVKSLKIKANLQGATILAEGVSDGMVIVTTPQGLTCEKMRNGVATVRLDSPVFGHRRTPIFTAFG